jgi:polyphosphate kinase
MNELKKKFFFNKIFIENMQEVFQKYNCDNIIDRYNDNLSQCMQNISMIVGKIETMNPSIHVDRNDSIDSIKTLIESMIEPEPFKVQQTFENITFDDIFENDILIDYPRISFDVYLQLLSLASTDKGIDSIYVSLYRIGNDPAIYYILRDAVNNGIDVYVNIELCASGELINQRWADAMRVSGIKVTTYATGKLKVHSKLTLFQFKSGKAIAQIGTGNYHTQTTSQYTDLSLLTSNHDICNQVLGIFNIFSGGKKNISFNKNLLVTRYNTRVELIKLIKREAKLGKHGYIAIKCNAFDDKEISKYLDVAAKNNCQIDLIVRGVCTWIPDQLGYNVRIKSIIWDKLEHSRVYCFGSSNPTIYLGSLDLVTSKLNNRIETLVKILDPSILSVLCDYLNHYITNASNSWVLLRSGEYRKEICSDELYPE